MYVYLKTEKACKENDYHDLYTVGFYTPGGKWESETDWPEREQAANRVALLNGQIAVRDALDDPLNRSDGSYRP